MQHRDQVGDGAEIRSADGAFALRDAGAAAFEFKLQ
jgi:hypothetical protein